MSTFNYIKKKKQLNPKTRLEFNLPEFTAGHDTDNFLILVGKYAGLDHNRELEILHRTKYARKISLGSRRLKSEEETARSIKEYFLEAYPEYVFFDWNVKDENGNKIQYDPAGCREFLNLLDDYVVNDIIREYGNPDNFLEDLPLNIDDAKEVGFTSSKQSSGKKKTETG